MSLDRFGNAIVIAWAEHEMVWLRAALTLDRGERGQAYADIASMTGRTMAAIEHKAVEIRRQQQEEAKALLQTLTSRRILVPQRRLPAAAPLAPTGIKPPSAARLMAGR